MDGSYLSMTYLFFHAGLLDVGHRSAYGQYGSAGEVRKVCVNWEVRAFSQCVSNESILRVNNKNPCPILQSKPRKCEKSVASKWLTNCLRSSDLYDQTKKMWKSVTSKWLTNSVLEVLTVLTAYKNAFRFEVRRSYIRCVPLSDVQGKQLRISVIST